LANRVDALDKWKVRDLNIKYNESLHKISVVMGTADQFESDNKGKQVEFGLFEITDQF